MHPRSSASSTARWVAGRNAVHCPSRYARARWFTGKLMVRGGLASRLALDEAGTFVGTRPPQACPCRRERDHAIEYIKKRFQSRFVGKVEPPHPPLPRRPARRPGPRGTLPPP